MHVHLAVDLPLSAPKGDLFYVDYGHAGWPEELVANISLSVSGSDYLAGGPCTLRTDHDRAWLTALGPVAGDAGVWRGCAALGPWNTSHTGDYWHALKQREGTWLFLTQRDPPSAR